MFHVSQAQIERAWNEGACELGIACDKSAGDITGEQLFAALKSGALTLLGTDVGWAAVCVKEYPNHKALHVEAIQGMTDQGAFGELCDFARHNGCDCIEGACQPALARLWAMRYGFTPAYTIMRKKL